ncbi:MAG: DNA polymerase III subunit beta [Bacilli bacterium]|nr:DNA polymerase III subunit beta [Bacilli bacterium]
MFKISRKDLLEGLKKATRGISTRSTLPILEGVLCEFGSGELKITGSDLTTSIIVKIPCETGMFDDVFILDGKMFLDIISKMSSDEIEVSRNDKIVTIKGGKSTFNINIKGTKEEYPTIEHTLSEKKEIVLKADVFKELLAKTVPFVMKDDTRPTLTGVLFSFKEGKITAVSLDGYRMGHTINSVSNTEEVDLIIKGDDLANIVKTLDKETIKISFSDNSTLVGFENGNTSIYTKQLGGQFFNFAELLKKANDSNVSIEVETMALKDAMERVNIVAKDGATFKPTELYIEEGHLIISTKSETGNAVEKIKIEELEGEQESFKIAFNPFLFLEGLKTVLSEKIELKVKSEIEPLFAIEKEGSFVYMLLPIRI